MVGRVSCRCCPTGAVRAGWRHEPHPGELARTRPTGIAPDRNRARRESRPTGIAPEKAKRPGWCCGPKPARPPGRLLVGVDPLSIDHRALAFFSTNVIARRSLRFGGRSACQSVSGCPARSPARTPLRVAPHRRPGRVAPRPVARPWCSPPQHCHSPPKDRTTAPGSSSYRHRFRLVDPVGLRFAAAVIADDDGTPTPFLGPRWACALRYKGHFGPPICAGQDVFSVLTGLSTAMRR